jgi:biopolymer transport protein ExbD
VSLEALKTNPGDDKSVYLRADQRANYGKVRMRSMRCARPA